MLRNSPTTASLRPLVASYMGDHGDDFIAEFDISIEPLPTLVTSAIAADVTDSAFREFVRTQAQNLYPLLTNPGSLSDIQRKLTDSTIAAYILLEKYPVPLAIIVDALRGAAALARSNDGVALDLESLSKTPIILPATFFHSTAEKPALGVMDMILLKHHVINYEFTDVTAIENVSSGETRVMVSRDLLDIQSETSAEEETATESSEEADSTDRFSFKREMETTTKEDLSVKAGVDIGYGTGGFHFSANASVDYQKSKEQTVKDATESAKEVTRKSVKKITQRVRTLQRRTMQQQHERTETHTITNASVDGSPNDHLHGVFRAIDAVHECGLFVDPQRTVVDMMVPEPAAFLRWIDRAQQATKPSTRPRDFTRLTPDGQWVPVLASHLSMDPQALSKFDYYGRWVAEYAVTNVPELPAATVTVSTSFVSTDEGSSGNFIVKGDLTIPANYRATSAIISGSAQNMNGKPLTITVSGTPPHLIPAGPEPVLVEKKVDFGVGVESMVSYTGISLANEVEVSLTITVYCELTDIARQNWLDRVHAAISSQYQKLLAAWEEQQVATSYAPKPLGIFGSSTASRNRKVERDEIKRSAASILLRRQLTSLEGAISPSESTNDVLDLTQFPLVDLENAQTRGAVARFVEQAFEWERMGYVFYPYYWGRPARWVDTVQLTNEDEVFQAFLQAGAARVVVPVRRGFETQVAYVLNTGELPTPLLIPGIGDPAYVSTWQESEAALAQPTDVPMLDAENKPIRWTVTVPTDLQFLEKDLPTFKPW